MEFMVKMEFDFLSECARALARAWEREGEGGWWRIKNRELRKGGRERDYYYMKETAFAFVLNNNNNLLEDEP